MKSKKERSTDHDKVSKDIQLSEVPLFKSLPDEQLAQILKNYKIWAAPAGTLVIEEGHLGDEFYVILHEQVEIVRALGTPEESRLGTSAAGEFIGEISLLNQGAPRTATVRAVKDTRLLVITYTDFNKLLTMYPALAYELASILSARLTEALNETIRNLYNKNQELQQAYDELKAAQVEIIKKEKLEHSLQVARKIQYSILPSQIPQPEGYDIGALMMPAQAVGGDFYGVYRLDDDHTALIDASFHFESRPALQLKGKAELQTVLAVMDDRQDRAIRLLEPSYALPMVGREKELQAINDKLDLAEGGKGQVIGIVAEAGMGKSRLAAEVIRSARKKGFTGYGGACQSDAINTPYQTWKSIWGAFFDVEPSASLKNKIHSLEGQTERALALWGLARNQPAWSSEDQREMELMLVEWALDPSVAEAGMKKGESLDWDETVRELMEG